MATVLYPERMYADDTEERRIFGPGTSVIMRDVASLAELSDEDCAAADGLMIFRFWLGEADFARFPKLRAVVRMGVGYDRIDRPVAAKRGVTVCNVPDYGTTEVADHAISLAVALSRGLIHHHERQRSATPDWSVIKDPAIRRFGSTIFGILGLGRIGTAVALRAKALGFHVIFYDPNLPNGAELAVGIARAPSLSALLTQSNILSVHTPLTRDTAGMLGAAEFAALPRGAVLVNTARGGTMDFDALEQALRSGHLSAAGLDVMPQEPPTEPLPSLLRAYRSRDPALEGRLIVTPHSAFWTPDAEWDIRIKSAETMAAALGNQPVNVIRPEDQ
jgi:phosphoglycerate dehydrogenase-like enzyme